MDSKLLQEFFEKYTNKSETRYRLPMSRSIKDFWPEELAYRKARGKELGLKAYNGTPYWFVLTDRMTAAGDAVAALARNEDDSSIFSSVSADTDYAIIDEAYFSSAIEGAYSTRKQAREFIESGAAPANRSEQMILNNYKALSYVLNHLEERITDQTILDIGKILTDNTLEHGTSPGYRNAPVYVVGANGETVYTAPDAEYVQPMMNQLTAFINDDDVHPIIKACAAHIYFVTVHPFFDGNGRTARALSLMILLKYGYGFFRQIPISDLLLQERAKYYKAIRSAQDPENGYDLTYFMEYYSVLLMRCGESTMRRLRNKKLLSDLHLQLTEDRDPRLMTGAEWLISENVRQMTADKWSKKYNVSFETARKDLNRLTELGFLNKHINGHKHFYELKTDK